MTADHIDRAAEIIDAHIRGWPTTAPGLPEHIARALDAVGLLATPEHDAAVAAKALRDAAPSFRHDRPSASVWAEMLDLADQIEAGES